jgi:hypothetical protein
VYKHAIQKRDFRVRVARFNYFRPRARLHCHDGPNLTLQHRHTLLEDALQILLSPGAKVHGKRQENEDEQITKKFHYAPEQPRRSATPRTK